MGRKLLVTITENSAKLETEQDLRAKDQYAGLVEGYFDFFRELHSPGLEEREHGRLSASQPDPLHLVLGEPLLGPVVKLGRAWALMGGHFLRVFERAAIGEISGNSGGAKCVATDFRRDAGSLGAPADHAPGVRLVHGAIGQRIGFVTARGAEQPALAVLSDPGRIDVSTHGL